MASARRQFHIEIGVTALLVIALAGGLWQDEWWSVGWISPALLVQFWTLSKLGLAAEEA